MLLFIHMHKCAGTTVRRSAQLSGLVLPERHRNGHLRNADGTPVRYAPMSEEEAHRTIAAQRDAGVGFMSIEWDVPPWHAVPADVTVFTVLREPLERAVSNFRYAKIQGRVPADIDFRTYFNDGHTTAGPLFLASNYYVRRLNALGPLVPLGDAQATRARTVLARFARVIVLGVDDLAAALAELGIGTISSANVTREDARFATIPQEALAVPDADCAAFRADNAHDIALFADMRRASAVRQAAAD